MRHSIKSTMFVGALLFGLSMCFTSCEDVLGHWEKPTPVTPTPTPTPEPEPEPTPTPGLLAGKFSVSDTKQVQFSQGNLQYTKSTETWSFMEHQWSTVETAGSVGDDYSSQDVVSLFGWGTSGYNHRTTSYLPYSTVNTDANYYAYNDVSKNLYDETGKADWGYNKISNGGNTENGWRTLTKDEWTYLFNNHTKGWATVNGVNGYVIRPDGITTAVEATYDATAWATEETNGAVFLPAAGRRDNSTVYYENGYYWSSSYKSTNAYRVKFSSTEMSPDNDGNRYFGHSVRLVRDAE